MNNNSLVKVPDGKTTSADPPKPFGRFFEFFYFPLGSSFIFIAIIGSPWNFFRMTKSATGFTKRALRDQYLKSISQKKLTAGKGLLIPFVYSGIESILSVIRETDDNVNILTAGALTGALYKAASGNHIQSWGSGGLLGFGLSSLYCAWKAGEPNNSCQEKMLEDNYNESWDE